MRLIYMLALALALLLICPAYADDDQVLPPMKMTGKVITIDGRCRSSVIIDDKIWFVGQQYLVKHGKLQHAVSRVNPQDPQFHAPKIEYNPKYDKVDIAVLMHVDNNHGAYILYRDVVYLLDIGELQPHLQGDIEHELTEEGLPKEE